MQGRRRRRGSGQHELVLLDGRGLQVDVQQGGAGDGVRGRRRGRRRRGRRLVVDAVGESLNQGLRARREGGRHGRFEPREGSGGGGALSGKIGRGGRRGRGRWRGRTLGRVLGKGGGARLSLRLGLRRGGEQRPLAAVGRPLRLRFGGVEEGGAWVVNRRGGQWGGVQLCGGNGGRFGSQRLVDRIRRPSLSVGVVLHRRSTGRLSGSTWRAGLRGTRAHMSFTSEYKKTTNSPGRVHVC